VVAVTIGARTVLAIGCALALAAPPAAAQSTDDLRAERTMGQPGAPVTMYIISDFECPYCGDFARNKFPTIEREYVATGKVQVVFVNMPLSQIHPNAEPAAELAMCAARQNRFWPMHNLLFRYQSEWAGLAEPRPFFLALGDSIHANEPELTACLDSHATRAIVKADYDGAIRSGAHSTPSFYIEGGLLAGDQPMVDFRVVLDSIYKARTEPARPAR
jgi:protein-disulfide isomerase